MNNTFDICDQINALIGDLTAMQREMTAESDRALDKAAEVIAESQRRIFAKANFRGDKENHAYKFADSSLIKISKKKLGRAKIKAYIGFDAETISEYPELLLVEFGRPGKSDRHSRSTDKLGRKKGDFPEAATVMPIRVGLNLAKESAFAAYADAMFDRAAELWRGE